MSSTIEDTIDRVEQLYATITGKRPPDPNGSATRMPPEVDPARHVEDQLGRLVEAIHKRLAPRGLHAMTWQPRAVAWQDTSGLELAIDVPGVSRDQLELSVDGNRLVLRGDRLPPWTAGELAGPPEPCEAPHGRLARELVLPFPVDPAQIRARLERGVLYVRVEHQEPARPVSVPIQA